MTALATADSMMPYSPNNDTVYTGIGLDLTQEPIILDMPAIHDRYAGIQIVNAYLENQPYVYSPRANGSNAIRIAFVGPDWEGELPDGLTRVQLDTNTASAAVRIALQNDDELDIVLGYQKQMTLTPLSAWLDGTRTPPPIPAAPARQAFEGPFAYFQSVAELIAENPPPAQHRAINASLWRVGLVPGQPFDPDALDPETRKGVERALADGPKVIEYIRKNRGKKFPSGWDAGRYAPDTVFDYAARAAMALVGLMGNDPEEAIYMYTYFDADGAPLDGSKRYRMHFAPEDLPKVGELGFWSITMYDGETYRFVPNPINRYALGSKNDLVWNEDGSLDLWFQAEAPEDGKAKNWLPTPPSGSFRVTCRIYSPTEEVVQELYAITLALPPVTLVP
jgi:DNA sulfur modification protein DndE